MGPITLVREYDRQKHGFSPLLRVSALLSREGSRAVDNEPLAAKCANSPGGEDTPHSWEGWKDLPEMAGLERQVQLR